MKVVSKTKTLVTLGGGRELKKSSNYKYTIIRDGLRSEGMKFEDLRIGDSVLCWSDGAVSG